MIPFDANKVLLNVRQATTENLLNRVTVYRDGMEPEAVTMIEAELHQRGVTAAQIQEHAERSRGQEQKGPDGLALKCSFCQRPAVARGWGWHRLWGQVPVFP